MSPKVIKDSVPIVTGGPSNNPAPTTTRTSQSAQREDALANRPGPGVASTKSAPRSASVPGRPSSEAGSAPSAPVAPSTSATRKQNVASRSSGKLPAISSALRQKVLGVLDTPSVQPLKARHEAQPLQNASALCLQGLKLLMAKP